MDDLTLRKEICEVAASLFARGFTIGSSGNISARRADGRIFMTPTNSCLGELEATDLSVVDALGNWIDGPQPTKEIGLHLAMYAQRPEAGAVIHLHSTYCVLLSVLPACNPDDVLKPITPYTGMKLGKVALVDYHPPGSDALASAVAERARNYHSLLLANHGPAVAGISIRAVQYAIEEFEEAAKLQFLLQGHRYRTLDIGTAH